MPRQSVDRGDDLGGGDRVGLGPGADLVAGAVDMAGLDSAAGQEERVAEVPVVAAGGGVDLGAAAEFAHDDDQRSFEHAARRQGRRAGSKRPRRAGEAGCS